MVPAQGLLGPSKGSALGMCEPSWKWDSEGHAGGPPAREAPGPQLVLMVLLPGPGAPAPAPALDSGVTQAKGCVVALRRLHCMTLAKSLSPPERFPHL